MAADAIDLMRAILGHGTTEVEARSARDEALEREADPLLWACLYHGISQAEAMRRAAEWADLAFFDKVPELPPSETATPRLEMLAEVRMCRLKVIDKDVAFAAPDFLGILRLRQARLADPSIRNRVCLVPPGSLRSYLVSNSEAALIDGARQTLARFWPYAAAQLDLILPLRWLFAAGLLALSFALMLAPLTGHLWLLPIWMVIMLLPTVMRFAALLVPAQLRPKTPPREADGDLPLYSVMVPLRDEANMVDQLSQHLGRLDYPPEKLEIIFVVESRSPETIAAVERHLGDARMSLVVVPDALPRTKPKALGFALPFCRGEFVVVYDAEDRPEPGQLRSIVTQFRGSPEIECIQARLCIDNADHGYLPTLFAGEYAGLFAVLLPALARWGTVMPLGGTSNHFRLATLRRLGGWDAYNVTEDADLGVRLARRNLRTATSVTVTLEDAPAKLKPWIGQRTRWMKGWMQTFVVHNRRARRLYADLGPAGFAMFQLTILSMLLAPILHIGMWPMLVWMQFDQSNTFESWSPWWLACLLVLVLGHGTAILVNMVGLARVGLNRFWAHQLLLPLYWLLITWATLLALREFLFRPFHWFKTPHLASRRRRLGGFRRPAAAE